MVEVPGNNDFKRIPGQVQNAGLGGLWATLITNDTAGSGVALFEVIDVLNLAPKANLAPFCIAFLSEGIIK